MSDYMRWLANTLFVAVLGLWIWCARSYFTFYRAWKIDKGESLGPIFIEVLAPLSLFWRDLSDEARAYRRDYVRSILMFLVGLGIFFVVMYFYPADQPIGQLQSQ